VAARLRRELGAEVEMVRARYGEFKVLVDGDTVIDGGALAARVYNLRVRSHDAACQP
jgi:hypothetical protein